MSKFYFILLMDNHLNYYQSVAHSQYPTGIKCQIMISAILIIMKTKNSKGYMHMYDENFPDSPYSSDLFYSNH